jgi:TRAP-type C4-dicarboxylate transport system substrate-binding protein
MHIALGKVATLGITLLALGLFPWTGLQAAETTLRLSTLFSADSDGGKAAQAFADQVEQGSNGRIRILVFPDSRLGDWAQTHEQLMQGTIDIGLQPLSTDVDRRLAVAWFPYIAPTYAEAQKVFSAHGFAYKLVDEMIAPQGLRLLGVYAVGMGGAGFTTRVAQPRSPEARRGLRVRVWPGGTTHRVMMQRFGYEVASVPWAELRSAMQSGSIDGQIGGTAEMALENFQDITKTWVQYNDHLELAWFVINSKRLDTLPREDRYLIQDIAQKIAYRRFNEVRKADARNLQRMEEAGIEVIRFSDQELESLAAFTRQKVWPQIAGELDEATMKRLYGTVTVKQNAPGR